MNQKRRNHFNVKFLRGYGISVNLKENKLVLKNGYDYFAKEQEKRMVCSKKAWWNQNIKKFQNKTFIDWLFHDKLLLYYNS